MRPIHVFAWPRRCALLSLLTWLAACHVTGLQAAVLHEIRVDGNTVLAARDIEAAVYPYLGPDGDSGKVDAAAKALEALYRERGYPTIGVVPSETVDAELRLGFARLQVYEQRVDRVRVKGGRYFLNRQVREATPSVASGEVLNAQSLQADLDRLASRTGDRRVRPVVKAGRSPGLLDVDLQVDDNLPLHGRLELNNLASANTSDLRLAATLSYNNLFQRQDAIVLGYQMSPERRSDVEVASLTYVHRPLRSNMVYSLTGVTTDSEVAAVAGTTVLGEGEFLIGRAIRPLRSRGALRDSLLFGFDYRNSVDITGFSRQVIEGVTRSEETQKKIDYMKFVVGYQLAQDAWGGRNDFGVTLNAGIRQLGNKRAEFEEKRFKGEPNFLYGAFSARRQQPLPRDFLLDIDLKARLTFDQLIGNEQLSIGGFNTVRGYLESERLADYGFLASVQVDTPLIRMGGESGLPLSAYAFWDWGLGRLHEPLAGEDDDFSLASAGVGLRLVDWFGFGAEAAWAHALRDSTATTDGDDHITFKVFYQF